MATYRRDALHWLMDGGTVIGLGSPGTVDLSWSVVGAADFGGDGKADILWRHTGGAFYLWEMNGIAPEGGLHPPHRCLVAGEGAG